MIDEDGDLILSYDIQLGNMLVHVEGDYLLTYDGFRNRYTPADCDTVIDPDYLVDDRICWN